MATVEITIKGTPYSFNYSITKTPGGDNVDRYWDFQVTHEHENLDQIPKNFSFKYDTRDNVQIGAMDGHVGLIAEKIIEQEGL